MGYYIVEILLFIVDILFESDFRKNHVKPLKEKDVKLIEKNCHYYNKLPEKLKRKFLKRVAFLINDYEIHIRDSEEENRKLDVLIAMNQAKLSFGLDCYDLGDFDHILMYPDEFTSPYTGEKQIGETNPGLRTIAMAKDDFLDGMSNKTDNLNLGLHELAHALFYTMQKSYDNCGKKFMENYKSLMKTVEENKEMIIKEKYFRAYLFYTEYETFPVLVEHFFETPEIFKSKYPEIYDKMCLLLQQNPLKLAESK